MIKINGNIYDAQLVRDDIIMSITIVGEFSGDIGDPALVEELGSTGKTETIYERRHISDIKATVDGYVVTIELDDDAKPAPTEKERIADLEEALDLLLSGVME